MSFQNADIQAGADGVDGAIDSMSGMTSQPSLGAIVRSMENTPKATGNITIVICSSSKTIVPLWYCHMY